MLPKRIIYLFGAGASHAEIMNLEEIPDQNFREKNSLLISDVSKRVMKKVQKKPWFKRNEEVFASTKGAFNIELFISLLEKNRTSNHHIDILKNLVQKDIKGRLSNTRMNKFYLHKALFELHKKVSDQENLLGIISLNYDSILDEAYEKLLDARPSYCFESEKDDRMPLLKLHGSFNWERIKIYGKQKKVSIIPIGMNKDYLAPPYNFIWGRAFELLVKCDILRIIGCSLSQNDTGLIDLLFKAHLERAKNIEIQIIDFHPQEGHHQIKNNYGFFPNIIEPRNIEKPLIEDEKISDYYVGNPFKIWLRAKAMKMLDNEEIRKTKFLKKCFN